MLVGCRHPNSSSIGSNNKLEFIYLSADTKEFRKSLESIRMQSLHLCNKMSPSIWGNGAFQTLENSMRMSLTFLSSTATPQRPPLPAKNAAGIPNVQSRVERFGLKPPEDPVRLARMNRSPAQVHFRLVDLVCVSSLCSQHDLVLCRLFKKGE